NAFQVDQNIPNPFNGSTEIRIQLPYDDNLTLSLYDLSGKQYACFSKKLASGMHKLQLRVAIPQMYILSIKTSTHTQNIKLLAKENADAFAIIYQNSILYAQPDKTQKFNTNKEFQSNDSMEFIGYTTYNNAKKTNQIKTLQTGNNANYTFQFHMGYSIGDVFYVTDGSIEGIVCWIADTILYDDGIYYGSYGKIISLDEPSSQGLMYATINRPTYAFDSIDGRVNTAIHMALRSDTSQYLYKERIEAAKWCTDKGGNWYFPAKCEMKVVFDNINIINNSLAQNKGITFRTYEDGSIYWTSTEKEGGEYAYTIYLLENKPKISYLQFYSKRYVRAMKWFNEP
ncbi:MAG: T9SS type A sorting domain-containing protein, partial [Bacteroidales bacterium]|nr:T9SS type A sorting domain-containing protein [Bacteroidales bacterium]